MTEESKSYCTNDLPLAGFLKAKGVKFLDMTGSKTKATFIFEDTPKTHELAKEFYRNGRIGVIDFVDALRYLKSLIFNRD